MAALVDHMDRARAGAGAAYRRYSARLRRVALHAVDGERDADLAGRVGAAIHWEITS